MQLEGRTILITGGSEGIGFALATALLPHNSVIVCGRSAEKLAQASTRLPGLITEQCDITDERQRNAMLARLLDGYPDLNTLINNAGAKHPVDLAGGDTAAALCQDTNLNFSAPVALSLGMLPHLQRQSRAAIINITTGLVYLPKADQAFYCAAKAALHSFTRSLRWALEGSSVEVYEVLMPLVDTGFHRGRLPANIGSITAEEAARRMLDGLRRDRYSLHVGKAGIARWLSLLMPSRGMALINR